MISKTCIIPWHEFKYMPIEHINQFCSDKGVNIRLTKNTLQRKQAAWREINIQHIVHNSILLQTKTRRKIYANFNALKDRTINNKDCAKKIGISIGSVIKYRKINGIEVEKRHYYQDITLESISSIHKSILLDHNISSMKCSAITKLPQNIVLKLRKPLCIRTKNCNK